MKEPPIPSPLHATLACPHHPERALVTTATEAFCQFGGERYPIADGIIDFGDATPEGYNLVAKALASTPAMLIYDRYQYITEETGVSPAFTSRIALIHAFSMLDTSGLMLDLGCGLGRVSRALAETLTDGGVVGLDNRLALLKLAASANTGAKQVGASERERNHDGDVPRQASSGDQTEHRTLFVHGDPMAPPFKDEAFDAIYSGATLHQISDPRLFLAAAHRVLKPGGRLILETVVAKRAGLLRRAQRAVRHVSGIQFAETETLYQTLDACGFELREEVLNRASLILSAVRRPSSP